MKGLQSKVVFSATMPVIAAAFVICFSKAGPSFAQMPHLEDMKLVDYGSANAAESYGSYADWDCDGLVDFINVENANGLGKVRFFKNTGTPGQPKFEFKEYSKHESGKELSLPIG